MVVVFVRPVQTGSRLDGAAAGCDGWRSAHWERGNVSCVAAIARDFVVVDTVVSR